MNNLRNFFLEYLPQEGIRSPVEYPYLIMLSYQLSIVNSWPSKEIGQKQSRVLGIIKTYINLFLSIYRIFSGSLYIWIHSSSMTFFENGLVYLTVSMDFVIMSRITTLTFSKKYRAVAKHFLTKVHLFYYKDSSEFAMKTHKQVHMLSHFFTLMLLAQSTASYCTFNLIPMYNNYSTGKYQPRGLKNETFEHSLYYSYPFNITTNVAGYVVACILHWIFSVLCGVWFCMIDLFLSLMVFNVWGHFKIIIHNLDNFPRPALKTNHLLEDDGMLEISNEMYSEEELQYVSIKLKEYIEYHRDIVNFTNEISDVFGLMLFVYYMFHQVSGCLLLLECSQMTTEALMRYLPLTLVLFQQLMQLSIVFELVGTISGKLKDAVYGLPWECMDTKNRKTVLIFLIYVQEPIHVKALGVANVGVTSMAMIIKTSLSYFTFLRSK